MGKRPGKRKRVVLAALTGQRRAGKAAARGAAALGGGRRPADAAAGRAAGRCAGRGAARKRPAAASSSALAGQAGRPPLAWRRDYPLIQRLRAARDAPVDTAGCEKLADAGAERADFEWQCLVAAMLSAQTKDQNTAEAMENLRQHGNTVKNIAATPVESLDERIAKVGFHATKAKHIKDTARLCLERHGGRVPPSLEGLLALPGVGPKMAHLTMHAAFDAQEGLCVDTHVHRITNALGWVETRTPEESRKALEAWLPREHWPHVNVLLVGLGQQQQQEPQRLVERCLAAGPPPQRVTESLRLLARLGLPLQAGRWPALDLAAKANPAVRRFLAAE